MKNSFKAILTLVFALVFSGIAGAATATGMNEFFTAGFGPVPEPVSMFFLGVSLIFFAGVKRKMQS